MEFHGPLGGGIYQDLDQVLGIKEKPSVKFDYDIEVPELSQFWTLKNNGNLVFYPNDERLYAIADPSYKKIRSRCNRSSR